MQRYANDGQRFVLWVLQEGCCAQCGDLLEEEEADHIITFAEGGATDIPNLQLVCKACHKQKTQNDLRRLAIGRRKHP